MANQYVNLPLPVGNGAGAAVDVSTFGPFKTVVIDGNTSAIYNIQFNNAAIATDGSWASLCSIQNKGQRTMFASARWMRVVVSGFNASQGGVASVDLGGDDLSPQFANLPVPATDGVGAAVDVSASAGTSRTVQIGGAFNGTLIIEISEDVGGVDWAPFASFQTPGFQVITADARWMRVRRQGTPQVNPGAPICNVAISAGSGGGGGGGSQTFLSVTTQNFALTPAITPAALALGNTNNYNPLGLGLTTRIRQATDPGNSTLTGLAAQSDGTMRIFENLGPGTLTLANENAGSAAANRFTCPGAADLTIASGGGVVLVYDATSVRWAVVAVTATTSTSFSHIALTPAITPAALANGNNNNYNPANLATSSVIRQATNAAGSTLTGLTAQGDGELRVITNLGPGQLIMTHEDANSTAANRFKLPNDAQCTLDIDCSITMIYDSTASRWRTQSDATVVSSEISVTPAISPAALAAGNTNDYAPAGVGITSVLRLATNAAGSTLTGMAAQNDGDIRIIQNLGPARLTLSHENAASVAANRFTCTGDQDLILDIDCAAIAIYDTATSRWRIIAASLTTSPQLGLSPAQSPAALAAGSTNNYNPAGLATTSRIRITPDVGGTSLLTGIVAQLDGDIRILLNLSSSANLTLSPEDASSTAANRFTLPGAVPFTIAPGGSCAIIYDGTTSRWTVLDKAAANSPSTQANTFMFGDGSDGDVVISVDTALTQNAFYHNLTVNSGINLTPSGFLVCVSGTLTLTATGTINANGAVGATGGASTNAGGAGGGANQYLSGGSGGGAGSNGGGGASSGAASRAYRGVVITGSGNAAAGAAGVSGGAGQGGGGGGGEGVGGSVAAGTTIAQSAGDIHDLFNAMNGGFMGRGSSPNTWTSGVGGGGGGGDNVTPRSGGGGGGGGGTVVVRANNIVGTGLIQAKGGNGGNGSAGAANRVGGGGGGSGGIIVVIQRFGIAPNATGGVTTSVTGGTGGLPVNAGGAGGAGGAGIVITGYA